MFPAANADLSVLEGLMRPRSLPRAGSQRLLEPLQLPWTVRFLLRAHERILTFYPPSDHRDPGRDDQMVDKMLESARALVAKSGQSMEVEAAQEGAEILLEAKIAVA